MSKSYTLKATIGSNPTKEIIFEGKSSGLNQMLSTFKEFLVAMGYDIHEDEYVVLFDTGLDANPFREEEDGE